MLFTNAALKVYSNSAVRLTVAYPPVGRTFTVLTWDKVNYRLYNNALLGGTAAYATPPGNVGGVVMIGGYGNNGAQTPSFAYNSMIESVIPFGRCLTPDDIAKLYRDQYSFIQAPSYQKYFSLAVAVPAAPSSLSITSGDGYNSLNWSSVIGATGYNLFRGTTPGGEGGSPINGSPVAGTNYVDSGLADGTTYYYVVKALGPGGSSAASPEASGTPAAATSPHRRWFPGLLHPTR
jgi:hypothetical protein